MRYIDVINRKSLNIEDERWRNLLNPSLLGLLSDEDIGDEVDSLTTTIEIKLPKNESLVKVSASLVTLGDNDEICFMIDSDFINQNKTDIDDVESKLNHFNEQGSRLIQWAISRKLFDAMEPEKI